MTGTVYLVGAGPGDPELITQRGLRLIQTADVILYDNLAPLGLLDHAKPGAETQYVGKKRAAHALSQEEINNLLTVHARAGKQVVRLKGGDPLIFGRGGEEAEALGVAGIPFQLVPGVSSALGVAAYAGIPLTHRSLTSSVTFVTGHDPEQIDWPRVGVSGTLVIFMGLRSFGDVARRLIAAGRDPKTPAAAIRWGSRPDQVVVSGTVANLAERVTDAGLRPPALVVVGEVVALRERLRWYEQLPLFGQRIVVTRAREQAGGFADKLRLLGAEAIVMPTIQIGPPDDWGPLDRAIERLGQYDWLIFTSQNGVRRFVERLDGGPFDLRAIRGKIAAIGPATAEALEELHLKVDLTPTTFVAEGLLEAFELHDLQAKKIVIPRAAVAREILPEELRRRGAEVDVAAAYKTVRPELAVEEKADWITFTSSSTASNLLEQINDLEGARVASIGPITSETVRGFGFEVDVEAEPHTTDGLIEAIVAAVHSEPPA